MLLFSLFVLFLFPHRLVLTVFSCSDELEGNPEVSRYRFYGYLAAFITSLYGHRPGVVTNMLLKEVARAQQEGSPEKGYIINVAQHKTAHVFGAAQLFLLAEEFSWIQRWVALRPSIQPKACNDLVFFTAGKGPMKNLNGYFQRAWAEMGLPGRPTFTDVRTAVSAHGKNLHSPEVRRLMTTYMCHDEATADKFYALSLSNDQSREMRAMFEATLRSGQDTSEDEEMPSEAPSGKRKAGKAKAKAKGKTRRARSPGVSSGDEDAEDAQGVVYQESGESDLETVVFSEGDLSPTASPLRQSPETTPPHCSTAPLRQSPAHQHWVEMASDMADVSIKHPPAVKLVFIF